MNWFKNLFNGGAQSTDANPHMARFHKLGDETKAGEKSVIDQYLKHRELQSNDSRSGSGLYDSTGDYHNYVYSPLSTNKLSRLNSYRSMANYPEVSNAVDEICEAMINYDENDQMVNLINNNNRITGTERAEITKEFDYFINLFNFDQGFFNYSRELVIDGELAWENIIDDESPEDGIIGVRPIENTNFEFLVDVETLERQGLFVFDNPSVATFDMFTTSVGQSGPSGQKGSGKTFDTGSLSELYRTEGIPLPWAQVTYVDSGNFDSTKLMALPVLEKARKAYKQLTLIEDAILIYRLVRAPERLVFNVSTGTLNRPRAEKEVQDMMRRFQTKQFYDPATGDVSNDYDAFQFLESYWFPKPEGSGGTTVESIGNAQFWTELPDLDYFRQKLFEALKVPFTRMNDATVKYENGESLSYEEYKFAKFIVRLQDRFAIGLLEGFKNHLKLKGIWDQYGLLERDLRIKFTPPTSYDLYTQQRLLKIKFENYDLVTKDHDELSKENAMRKYLGYSDVEIETNKLAVEKEMIWQSYLDYKKSKIGQEGIKEKTVSPTDASPESEEPDVGGGLGF